MCAGTGGVREGRVMLRARLELRREDSGQRHRRRGVARDGGRSGLQVAVGQRVPRAELLVPRQADAGHGRLWLELQLVLHVLRCVAGSLEVQVPQAQPSAHSHGSAQGQGQGQGQDHTQAYVPAYGLLRHTGGIPKLMRVPSSQALTTSYQNVLRKVNNFSSTGKLESIASGTPALSPGLAPVASFQETRMH